MSECQLEKEREEMLLNNADNLPHLKPSHWDLCLCRCRWKSAPKQILSFSLFSFHGCCHDLFTIYVVMGVYIYLHNVLYDYSYVEKQEDGGRRSLKSEVVCL